jgi:hypothetical protein
MDTSDKEPVRKLLYFIQILGIVSIPIIITMYIFLISKRQYIRDNWLYYRKQPYIIPFAGFLAPPGSGITTTSNFNYIIGEVVKKTLNILLAPIYFILKTITSSIKNIGGVLNTMRDFTSNIRTNILSYFSEITNRFDNVLSTLQYILIKLNDVLGKAGGMGRVAQYMLYVVAASLEVIVNVIGDILRIIIYILIALSILLFWWFPVLAAILGILAAGMGIAYCFDPDTMIDMEDGTQKKISKMKIGDTLKGGKVNGIIIATSKNINMYKYNNIIVSGEHLVYENKWIRVKDSKHAQKYNYNKDYIYCLITESNLIYINNNIFKDYEEISDREILTKIEKITMKKLNNIDYTPIKNNFDYNGFYKNTLVKMKNGLYTRIKDIKVGDVTSQGIVIAIIKNISGNYLYDFDGEVCSGENIIYHDNIWKRVYTVGKKIKKKAILFHLSTDNGIIETENNIYRDFTEIRDGKVMEEIEELVLSNINN